MTEQLRAESREKGAVEDLNFQVGRLSQENVLLKEANEKITASAFDVERERRHRKEINELKLQLMQLETTLKVRVVRTLIWEELSQSVIFNVFNCQKL